MTTFLLALTLIVAAPAGAVLVMLPSPAGEINSAGTNVVANALNCATYVSPVTMTATKFSGYKTGGTGTMGFAIYDETGATEYGEATVTAGGAPASATGLTIPLVAGTRFLVCVCSTLASATYPAIYQANGGVGALPDLLNAGAFPATVGVAANPCVTGNPPATTGALTPNITFKLPVVVVE